MVYPLEGIKVLDFSIAVAAPFGAMMLADMGAEVIKVERLQGEAQRLGLPAGMDDKINIMFFKYLWFISSFKANLSLSLVSSFIWAS